MSDPIAEFTKENIDSIIETAGKSESKASVRAVLEKLKKQRDGR